MALGERPQATDTPPGLPVTLPDAAGCIKLRQNWLSILRILNAGRECHWQHAAAGSWLEGGQTGHEWSRQRAQSARRP